MSLSVREASRYANVSDGTITKLVKAGHLQGKQDHPGAHWRITTPKADIKKIVLEHSPTSGWKKSTRALASGKGKAAASGLRDALAFIALDAPTRVVLIALAEKFSADELQLILSL